MKWSGLLDRATKAGNACIRSGDQLDLQGYVAALRMLVTVAEDLPAFLRALPL